MLHRNDQVYKLPLKYDIVKSKITIRVVPGVMNSYNKQIEEKCFEGYGLVSGHSENFATVYLPNRERKLIKRENLIVVIEYKKTNKKCKFKIK